MLKKFVFVDCIRFDTWGDFFISKWKYTVFYYGAQNTAQL